VFVRKLLGDALGFPFEVGIALAHRATQLVYCNGECYQYIILKCCSKRAEWDTNTYCQAVNTLHIHQSSRAAPPYPYHDAPKGRRAWGDYLTTRDFRNSRHGVPELQDEN
jgi:hypothetical protein